VRPINKLLEKVLPHPTDSLYDSTYSRQAAQSSPTAYRIEPLLKKLFAPHLGFLKTHRYQYMMITTSQSGNEKSRVVDPDPVDPSGSLLFIKEF
jgi:hypothetical protein